MQLRDEAEERYMREKTAVMEGDVETLREVKREGRADLQAEVADALEAQKAGDDSLLRALTLRHGMHLPGITWKTADGSKLAVQPDGSFHRLNKPVSKQERRKREARAAKVLGVKRGQYATHHEFLLALKHAAIEQGHLPANQPADGAEAPQEKAAA